MYVEQRILNQCYTSQGNLTIFPTEFFNLPTEVDNLPSQTDSGGVALPTTSFSAGPEQMFDFKFTSYLTSFQLRVCHFLGCDKGELVENQK